MTKKKSAAALGEPDWAEGARQSVPAKVVHKTFEQIRAKHGGLTRKNIVDEARSAKSPIHSCFEWDDRKAGEAYRLDQAGHLQRCLIYRRSVEGEDRERITRAWVPISPRGDDDTEDTVYKNDWMPIEDAMADPRARAQLVARALAEVQAWQTRYRDLDELAVIFAAIDKKTRRAK